MKDPATHAHAVFVTTPSSWPYATAPRLAVVTMMKRGMGDVSRASCHLPVLSR
jgi:hypothetical protein